ncbi:MAG: amino acid adenylation domain-containing protein [Myxococcales bacterium]
MTHRQHTSQVRRRDVLPASHRETAPHGRDDQEIAHLPASRFQELLFAAAQREGALDHEQVTLRFDDAFEPARLLLAFAELTRRHPALRASFQMDERAEVARRIHAGACVAPELVHLQRLSRAEAERELERLAQRDLDAPFTLDMPPLMRLSLASLPAGAWACVWTVHHLLLDCDSLVEALVELAKLYVDPDRPTEVASEEAWLASGDAAGDSSFAELLCGVQCATRINFGVAHRHPSDEAPTQVGKQLTRAQCRELERAGHALGVDLETLLEAAWALALWHYTQESDLLFGSQASGRDRPQELSARVGPLPTRIRCEPAQPLGTWLEGLLAQRERRARCTGTSAQELQAHTEIPRGQPLFALCVCTDPRSLHDRLSERLNVPGLTGVAHGFRSSLPLVLGAEHGERGLTLRLNYHPRALDHQCAQRFVAHVTRLLTLIARAKSSTPLGDFAPLSLEEHHALVEDWNATERAYPSQLRLHDLFEAQVRRTPDAVALVDRAGSMSFTELDARANRIAHTLRARGVVHRDRVAVCLPRSFDLVATLLAVSKIGASYVPLEPSHPEERIRFTLEDTEARLLVTAAELSDATSLRCATLNLRLEAGAIAASPGSALPAPGSSDDEAYVIYTSGSTGQPKGVVVRQRAVANLIDWVNRRFEVGPRDRLLFVTSVCFDLSVYDVFGVLGAGASLYVASADELRDPAMLSGLIDSAGITLWDSAPAALTQLVPFLPERGRAGLRMVLLSGDWIPVPLPDQLRRAHPGARVVSLGGATEATVWSNYFEVDEVDAAWPSIPYGRPIQNARYYVLDAWLRPVPMGVMGDLYIGGTCVADGYLKRPELDAARFVSDPFTGEGKLYRTGDLARSMPDGNLEFLGRRDAQVKIRGFRIELGEVEAALNQLPDVVACVVDAPVLADAQRSLVAYVVSRGARDAMGLREACARRLPEYMLPSRIVFLDGLPLTPHGKLDRRALPAPEVRPSVRYEAPRGELERALAERFARLLGRERVGRNDDFFELGGHSLLATQLIGELAKGRSMALPLPRFLANPSVRALAEWLAESPAETEVPCIAHDPTSAPVVSLEQSRLAFVQGLDPAVATYNIALGFRLEGELEPALLRRALEAVLRRHEPLRTRFVPGAQGHTAELVEPCQLPWELRDLSALSESERHPMLEQAMREISGTPFDLAHAPLLRATLVKLGAREHALLIAVHHIVFDGPSGAILLRDLLAHYDALVADEPAHLPALTLRFNDVALHQQRRLEQRDQVADLAYWRDRLKAPLPILQLPHDRPRPKVFSFHGAIHPFDLSPEESAALRKLARQRHTSVFTLLMSAFSGLLHRYSGQSDVLVAIPVAMRDQRETQDLIGLLLNTLVIRSALAPGMSFEALMDSLKQRFLEALEHRELPFERLVADLNPPRDPALTPVFQAFFSYEETSGRAAQSRHLTVSRMLVDQVFAGTDLSLFVEDDAEGGIRGYFEYSSDLFERATIAGMAQGFQRLLAALPSQAELPLERLPILSANERTQQLRRWNQTELPFTLERSVVERFEEMARRHGKKSALYFEDTSLSYRDLRAGVHLLAAELRAQGVGPGSGVAVLLERSPRLVMALLAVWKTGAHYIPLDPAHPAARNQGVLEAARPALVLAEERTRSSLPPALGDAVYDLDAPRKGGSVSSAGLPTRVDPESLAYVIFTSGSTGEPKGVEVTHRALTNLLCSMALRPGFDQHDRLLALTTVSFDIAALELFLPLICGGSLEIARRELALDPDALLARLRDASVFQATPATFRMLLERPFAPLPQLRLLCGGEALPLDLACALRPRVKALWNMYGPTETTIWSSVDEVSGEESIVSIGSPIHNTRIYVLDEALEPVPSGVVGQLYIAGSGVARGYHGRPDLTARVFLPDPFDPQPDARMVRTGDLGRRLPDGRLVCLGRTDFQVKVRGYRVELGEIEAALRSHTAVHAAVVHANSHGGAAEPELRAYVVLEPPLATLPEDFHAHLRELLPHYMVPSHVMLLPSLPLTPNGKVDRRALPEPEPGAANANVLPGEAPCSDLELEVLGIVSRHLGRPALGFHENFFDLGGHSLMAVRVVREINQAFALELPVGVLFQAPTVAGLSAAVVKGGGKLSSAVVPLRQGKGEPPLYFICGIQLYHRLAQHLADQTSYGIFVHDEQAFLESSGNALGASIPRLARAYADAIQAQTPRGPYALAGISFGGLLAYEVARQLRERGEEVSLLVLLDSVLPSALQRRTSARLRHLLRQLRGEPVARLRERARRRWRAFLRRPVEPRVAPADRRPELLWRAFSGGAAKSYFARSPSYEGPTLIVRAGDRSDLAGVEVAADLGWGPYLNGPLQVAEAAADHLGILGLPATAELIREHLALWRDHASRSSASRRRGSPRPPSSCP